MTRRSLIWFCLSSRSKVLIGNLPIGNRGESSAMHGRKLGKLMKAH